MFGTLSDRLRKWLEAGSWPPNNNAAADARLLPEPPETADPSGNSANERSKNGSATGAVVGGDSISPTVEQVKLNRSLKEAPGVTKPRGDSQTAN